MRRVLGWVIGAAIMMGLCVLGTWLFVASLRSDADIAREASAPYLPICNHHAMAPGDTCVRFGDGADSQTYDQMVAQHAADSTPDKLRHQYANRRWTGAIMVGVGAGALTLTALTIVRSSRRRGQRVALS
jgi:hypothetical protein